MPSVRAVEAYHAPGRVDHVEGPLAGRDPVTARQAGAALGDVDPPHAGMLSRGHDRHDD